MRTGVSEVVKRGNVQKLCRGRALMLNVCYFTRYTACNSNSTGFYLCGRELLGQLLKAFLFTSIIYIYLAFSKISTD